jgi:hypothetical protein
MLKPMLLSLGIVFGLVGPYPAVAQPAAQRLAQTNPSAAEQEIITLSKDKWRWMAERNVEALDKPFAPEAVFVHMGGTMTRAGNSR